MMQENKNLEKDFNQKIRVVIPAAGIGKRTGLSYPKCLFEVNDKPIIIHILEKIINLDNKPILVINSDFESEFAVTSLQFSPDGMYLLSGGRDAKLNIWNTSVYSVIHLSVAPEETRDAYRCAAGNQHVVSACA